MMKLRFVEIVLQSKNPIGTYLLLSELTCGTRINEAGLFISLNNVGVSVSFLLPASGEFSLSRLQTSTRLSAKGIFLNSAGVIPTSHKHHRSLSLMNSADPTKFLIYGLDCGSFLINSS